MIGRAALVVLACVGIRDLQSPFTMPGSAQSLVGGLQPTEDDVIADLPFASTEQALIVYDDASKIEHLVMELRFDKSDGSFGLLVPVPSSPTVEKVATAPFDQLRDIYTFSEPGLGIGYGNGNLFDLGNLATYGHMGGGLGGAGAGSGSGGTVPEPPPPPAVEVLDEHPVGSFTSFTLAIHDAGELDAWLKEKGFAAPKAVGPWAERYARMDFTIVALKYTSGSDAGAQGTTSQTVRISFGTPQIYFPYSEPVSSKLAKRLTAAWVIAPGPVRPIARLEDKKSVAQPWRSGMRFTATHEELATIFKELAAIMPAGDKLSVQTYRDWKTSREGWGDILFVPQKPMVLDDASKAERRRMLGLLDPDLVPAPKPKPVAIASLVAVASAAPASGSEPAEAKHGCGGCNAAGSSPSPLLLLALAILSGRRRAFALLALAGCTKPTTSPSPADAAPEASASAATVEDATPLPASTLSADDENARVEAAYSVLAGEMGDAGITILAGTAPIPPPFVPKPVRPQATVVLGNFQTQGTLAKEIVQRVLLQHRNQYRYCYEKGLQTNPMASGKVTIRIMIHPSGEVASSVLVSTTAPADVANCQVGVSNRNQFPAEAGVTTAIFSVDMKPAN